MPEDVYKRQIRMTVGIGFKRARLRYAYMLLRGKDLRTGEILSLIHISSHTQQSGFRLF